MALDKRNMYRFPWSMNDNPLGWAEITDVCNLKCKGCYRQTLEGHKPIDQIKEEILFLKRWRNCDNISIAGGEPILHPQIVDIVDFISRQNMKPLILSNGMTVTRDLLIDLREAGLIGICMHIDMYQNRPGWEGNNEIDLNKLREKLADIVYEVGGISCLFNITVYKGNYQYIPDLVNWTLKNTKKVQGFIFICYRAAILDPNKEYSIDGHKVELDEASLGYATSEETLEDINIKSSDVYRIIKEHLPQYEPSAYLGGTKSQKSIKWLISILLCGNNQVFGPLGKKAMELIQVFHHLWYGTYLAYMRKKTTGKKIFLLSLIDPMVFKALKQFLHNPVNFFRPLRTVGISCIQAPDVLAHGEVDMCDSCPDMAFFDGNLVNSCRLDEYRKFGTALTPEFKESTPKKESSFQYSNEKK